MGPAPACAGVRRDNDRVFPLAPARVKHAEPAAHQPRASPLPERYLGGSGFAYIFGFFATSQAARR